MIRNISIGGVTILVIFIVLALSIFSVTALSYANADLTFSKRLTSTTQDYYNADGLAQEVLSEIDAILAQGGSDFSSIWLAPIHLESDNTLSFTIPVTQFQALQVQLSIDPLGNGYQILSYRVMPTEDEDAYDQSLNLWDGTMEVFE